MSERPMDAARLRQLARELCVNADKLTGKGRPNDAGVKRLQAASCLAGAEAIEREAVRTEGR